MVYFGPWTDGPDRGAQAALDEYERQANDLHAGRTPRPKAKGLTVAELCNRFLTVKRHLIDTHELAPKSFADYFRVCKRIVDNFGRQRSVVDLGPEDFAKLRSALASKMGPTALFNEIGRIRVVFKFGVDEGLIDRALRYGQGFARPSRKTLRKVRAARGPRMFEADELRKLIDGAAQPLKAMILLGANCGFGQTDVANLPRAAVDLKTGWIDYPRPKTGVERRCPLWPETIAALQEAITSRPRASAPEDAGLVFLTKYGRRWVRTKQSSKAKETEGPERSVSLDAVAQEFAKLKVDLDVNGNRAFYALRHTFQTIGEDSGDLISVKAIMGHVDNSMSGTYRERISDERLRKVTDHLRAWLFLKEEEGQSND